MSYTKLFNSIITSTIWTEDDKTRIVWITMIAMADQNGEVQGAIPGLARMAGVSIEDTENALNKFLSPDPYSRTKADQGRRIEEIEGGWSLINHAKYRRMASKEDQKEKNAERQRRFKAKQEGNAKVTGGNAKVTEGTDIAEAEAEAEVKADRKPKNTPPKSPKGDLVKVEEIYQAYPRKEGKPSALKAITKALRTTNHETLLEKTKAYAKEREGEDNRYTPHPATWFNDERFNDEPTRHLRNETRASEAPDIGGRTMSVKKIVEDPEDKLDPENYEFGI